MPVLCFLSGPVPRAAMWETRLSEAHLPRLLSGAAIAYGWQRAGVTERSGLLHSGPRLVVASGRLIIASGPARCSPLKGVGWVTSKPQAAASCGLLNQKPTWNVLVGARLTSGSKPKI